MWSVSSSVNAVNLVKKNLQQFQRYRIFARGITFLAHPVYFVNCYASVSDCFCLHLCK